MSHPTTQCTFPFMSHHSVYFHCHVISHHSVLSLSRHTTACTFLSYHTTSCTFPSHHKMYFPVMSHHIMYFPVTPQHVLSCHVTPHHVLSCHTTECAFPSCHTTSCTFPVMSHHIIMYFPCDVMPQHVLCHVTPYHRVYFPCHTTSQSVHICLLFKLDGTLHHSVLLQSS